MVPESIWTDPAVSAFAVRVLGYLVAWMRLHPGRFPETKEIARDLGRTPASICAAIRLLERAGYLIIIRRGRGIRYHARLGYRLRTPGPRAVVCGGGDQQQGILFPLGDSGEAKKTRFGIKKNAVQNKEKPCSQPPPLTTPLIRSIEKQQPEPVAVFAPHREIPGNPPTEQEEIADLLERAQELTPTSPGDIQAALKVYTFDELDAAISALDDGRAVNNWGYVLWMAAKHKRDATPVPMQNYNPGPKEEKLPEFPTEHDIADAFERAKEPGKVGEMWQRLIARWTRDGVISADPGTSSEAKERPAESPPSTVSPQPARSPNPIGPVNYTASRSPRKINRSNGEGQRARQDSNLQPSDSKAESCKALCDNTKESSGEEARIEMKIPQRGSDCKAEALLRARLPSASPPLRSQA